MRLTMRLTKLFPLLTGAFLLSIAVPYSMPAHAQESQPAPVERHNKLMELNLTPEQQTQIRQIEQDTREQVKAILTPEQQAQFKAARENGGNKRELWSSLNLTSEQKAKMREIRESSKQKFDAVLTSEQLEKLRQMRQSNRANNN